MPETLKKNENDIAEAAARSGSYKNKEEFVEDAINTFLAARKDLRKNIAAELYKENKISIGRACEIAKLDREKIKKELNKRDIKIKRGPKDKSVIKDESDNLLGNSA